MQRAELNKKHWCPVASENEHESSFHIYSLHEFDHSRAWLVCMSNSRKGYASAELFPSLKHPQHSEDVWGWLPFVKCCLPFIIKGSSYSWLLPKADFNFIVQTNRETVCSATPKLIHGRAESNLQDTWYNCHLPALTNNVQQFYFIYFFFWDCFQFPD